MTKQYRHRRSENPANPFPTLEPGELSVNTANRQIAMGDAAAGSVGVPMPVIAVRFFDARGSYAINDMVVQAGKIYKANAAIPPGAFNVSNWTEVGAGGGSGGGIPEAPNDGVAYARKNLGWVPEAGGSGGGSGDYLPLSGGTITGDLNIDNNGWLNVNEGGVSVAGDAYFQSGVTGFGQASFEKVLVNGDPVDGLELTTKQYVDARVGGGGGAPGGANTQVQFNKAGAFGGNANMAWNDTLSVLTLTGQLTLNMGSAKSIVAQGVVEASSLQCSGVIAQLSPTVAGNVVLRPNGPISATGQVQVTPTYTLFNAPIRLPADPTAALEAATKQYVDNKPATDSTKVLKAGDTMTGRLQLPNGGAGTPAYSFSTSSATGMYLKADGVIGFTCWGGEVLNINGDGTINSSNGSIFLNGGGSTLSIGPGGTGTNTPSVILNSGTAAGGGGLIDFQKAGSTKLRVGLGSGITGGTVDDFQVWMPNAIGSVLKIDGTTGLATVKADPTAPLGIATKQYVDAAAGGGGGGDYLPLTGGKLTGHLEIETATDARLRLLTGATGAAAITGRRDGVNRWVMNFIDGSAEGADRVGSNFQLIGYDNAGAGVVAPMDISRLDGLIKLQGDPTAPLHAATKQYVDGRPATDSTKVLKAGDTMTGALALPAGTMALPSINFGGDTAAGFYRKAANSIAVSCNNFDAMSWASSGKTTFGAQALGYAGSATVPSYGFASTISSGMYISATNTLGFTASGALRLSISPTLITSTLPIVLPADPASALHAATKQYADTKASKAGDIFTGDVYIMPASAQATLFMKGTGPAGNASLMLDKSLATMVNSVEGAKAGSLRWRMLLADSAAESGSNAGSNFQILRYDDSGGNGAIAFQIARATGNATFETTNVYKPGGGSFVATSDARIKTVDSEYEQGLDAVAQLRPVNYRYKGNETAERPEDTAPYSASPNYSSALGDKNFIGLIAQEVEAIFPEMVTKRTAHIDGEPVNDLRDLDTGPLIFALINSVKELKARLEMLEGAA